MALRFLILAAAALALAGCVTPMTAAQQTPTIQYQAPNRTLVAVVDDRTRVRDEGRPENFLGYARSMGIPGNWTVETVMIGNPDDKKKTMAELLSARIASALAASGGEAESVVLGAAANDGAANDLLQQKGASNLLTLVVQDWHFDINLNWVGRFQFNSDVDLIVQRAGSGTVVQERFTERQAIQAEGDQSWQNMILQAYRGKLEEMLNDADVRAAMTAAPEAASAPPAATDATALAPAS